MTILDRILADKKEEVRDLRMRVPLEEVAEQARRCDGTRSFLAALKRSPFSLIAEIKKASPSRGTMVENFNHRTLAQEFENGGAHALSVLTDRKYFGGDPSFIREVKQVVGLPVLRKDFIIDEYQIYESRALGADAILLIVRALSAEEFRRLMACARSVGLDVLVETHDRHEIEVAHSAQAEIVGINNRDLLTFEIQLETSMRLREFVDPEALAVSESGIQTRSDVMKLRDAGFQAALVGEGLVTKADRVAAVRELIPD